MRGTDVPPAEYSLLMNEDAPNALRVLYGQRSFRWGLVAFAHGFSVAAVWPFLGFLGRTSHERLFATKASAVLLAFGAVVLDASMRRLARLADRPNYSWTHDAALVVASLQCIAAVYGFASCVRVIV